MGIATQLIDVLSIMTNGNI